MGSPSLSRVARPRKVHLEHAFIGLAAPNRMMRSAVVGPQPRSSVTNTGPFAVHVPKSKQHFVSIDLGVERRSNGSITTINRICGSTTSVRIGARWRMPPGVRTSGFPEARSPACATQAATRYLHRPGDAATAGRNRYYRPRFFAGTDARPRRHPDIRCRLANDRHRSRSGCRPLLGLINVAIMSRMVFPRNRTARKATNSPRRTLKETSRTASIAVPAELNVLLRIP